MGNDAWWGRVEEVIETHSLLKHPFYQAWQAGKLTVEDLRYYAQQYYPHVARFPRYVSAVHSNCDDLKLRQRLLENLIEEERGPENHPELWLRFAEGLGLDRSSVLQAEVRPETKECVESFTALCRDGDPRVGLAALYAYESQIPAVSRTKLQGLADFYGITTDRARAFFKVHQEADVWHSQEERETLESLPLNDAERETVVQAAAKACQAVWKLLDGVCEARKICVSC